MSIVAAGAELNELDHVDWRCHDTRAATEAGMTSLRQLVIEFVQSLYLDSCRY
jgi:hypothetical protein